MPDSKNPIMVRQPNPIMVRQSNRFVTAKYQTSLVGNQLIALSLTKLHAEAGSPQMFAKLYPAEIRRVMGKIPGSKNLYKQLNKASRELAGNVITIEDGHGNFRTFNLITNVDYENGVLLITYNREMTPYISKLTTNYSQFELSILMSFSTNASFRLYQVLHKEIYRLRASASGYISVRYGLNELKAMLGLINMDALYIRRAVEAGMSWDDIAEKVARREDRQYDRFTDFRNRVLEVAKAEMKEKTDIRFEYTAEKGAHGKVRALQFMVYPNNPAEEARKKVSARLEAIEEVSPEYAAKADLGITPFLTDDNNFREKQIAADFADATRYLTENGIEDLAPFTLDYFRQLLDDAGGDKNVIHAAIKYGKSVPHIRNYFGWLREAVRGRYAEQTVETIEGSTENADRVRQITGTPLTDHNYEHILERYRKMPEYQEFLNSVELSEEELEMIYEKKDIIKMFIQYKTKYRE
ncbi:MAG: replication initiation protein [Chordicoccus sp.]